MKVLICGSRNWPTARKQEITERIDQLQTGDTVIAGAAKGVDKLAAEHARGRGLTVEEFPANWDAHGKSAGFKRNVKMLNERPDLVIAYQYNDSPGTNHTIEQAFLRGIKTEVVR